MVTRARPCLLGLKERMSSPALRGWVHAVRPTVTAGRLRDRMAPPITAKPARLSFHIGIRRPARAVLPADRYSSRHAIPGRGPRLGLADLDWGVMAETGLIRTPDQRVRVFVSSPVEELAAERQAVRDAIAGLRLGPVIPELGATPYPPRNVYQAFLAQSQIFVGIYGQSYGRPAPGEQMSALEDEYQLSAGLPRLIYV